MAEDKWSQKGITFKILTLDDYGEIKAFLDNYYFPEDPIHRGLKFYEGNGYFDKKISNVIYEHMITNNLKDATSIVAIDENGDIVGSRLGEFI